jgi:predicted RNA-binding Zn-ribbon protein involved in translation (DUF1610 family)
MEQRTCTGCGKEIDNKNDSMMLRRMLSEEEYNRYKPFEKDVCTSCKKEMFFAGILEVI